MQSFTDLISVAELSQGQPWPDWRVVDCRFDLMNPGKGRADYLAGHVPGAVYAHLDDDLAAPVTASSGRHPLPGAAEFAATVSALGISSNDQVVAYDGAGGAMAARLWWMLRWLGHERVAVLDGGFAAWQAAAQPTEAGEAGVPAGVFVGTEQPGWVLDTAELATELARGQAPMLIDAREAPRYAGKSEPIDAAAGHVPGALNFPFAQNLHEDGRWQDASTLAERWKALLPAGPAGNWAVMCGSGVTACHLALSAKLAGLPPPRLYAGSWSEWIRDPGRPREP